MTSDNLHFELFSLYKFDQFGFATILCTKMKCYQEKRKRESIRLVFLCDEKVEEEHKMAKLNDLNEKEYKITVFTERIFLMQNTTTIWSSSSLLLLMKERVFAENSKNDLLTINFVIKIDFDIFFEKKFFTWLIQFVFISNNNDDVAKKFRLELVRFCIC